jgi:acetyl-CoA carboxylase beta subunit
VRSLWEEFDQNLVSSDPLNFKDTKQYADRLLDSKAKTDSYDALVSAVGTMGGLSTVMAVMEYGFIGGSMGVVVGEKVTRAVERAIRERLPVARRVLLGRGAHDGGHALADADGEDLGRAGPAGLRRSCPSSR